MKQMFLILAALIAAGVVKAGESEWLYTQGGIDAEVAQCRIECNRCGSLAKGITTYITLKRTISIEIPDITITGVSVILLKNYQNSGKPASLQIDSNKSIAPDINASQGAYIFSEGRSDRIIDQMKTGKVLRISYGMDVVNTIDLRGYRKQLTKFQRCGTNAATIAEDSVNASGEANNHIARWYWQMTDTISAIVTIDKMKLDGTYPIHHEFSDGSARNTTLKKRKKDGKTQYYVIDDKFGAYYTLLKSGNLKVFDKDGYIRTLKQIK